jgi:hypothetical protein
MRSAEGALMRLVMAFDGARRAFELDVAPGWGAASADLDEALARARDVLPQDLPCPPAWWRSALEQTRCWLLAGETVRRGLTPAVKGTIDVLSRYSAGTVAQAEAPHGAGVR